MLSLRFLYWRWSNFATAVTAHLLNGEILTWKWTTLQALLHCSVLATRCSLWLARRATDRYKKPQLGVQRFRLWVPKESSWAPTVAETIPIHRSLPVVQTNQRHRRRKKDDWIQLEAPRYPWRWTAQTHIKTKHYFCRDQDLFFPGVLAIFCQKSCRTEVR